MPKSPRDIVGDAPPLAMQEAGPPHVQLPGVPSFIPEIPKGDLLHTFRAYVRGCRVANTGELLLTLGVDPEHKWAALPLTDIRAMMFVVEIYDPKPLEELFGTDYIAELERVVSDQSPVFDPTNVIDLTGRMVPPPFHFEDDDGD